LDHISPFYQDEWKQNLGRGFTVWLSVEMVQ